MFCRVLFCFVLKFVKFVTVSHIPDWFPGASFKRIAAQWRYNGKEFVERPYTFVKHQMALAASTAPRTRSPTSLPSLRKQNPRRRAVAGAER